MSRGGKISREDFRKNKELDEARKAGTAPAEVDESGRDINPHIPEYIKSAPWYLGFNKPTLTHQRIPSDMIKEVATLRETVERGVKTAVATRYRKGACENCGAMTHAKRDCVERPRKLGARFTNDAIAPDEAILPVLPLDFDGKHDRWAGYDPSQYQHVVDEFEKLEAVKRKAKADQLKEEIKAGPARGDGDKPVRNEDSSSDSGEDSDAEEKGYAEKADQPGTKLDTKRRITVRNLRIREDTAKYLRNLDPNSAYYDPKTRTMRSNPYEHLGVDPAELTYAGDNFVRYGGETQQIAKEQLFAWEAAEKGMPVHLQADPTLTEIMHKRFAEKREVLKTTLQSTVLEKYGGEEHLNAPPKELLMAQSEFYTEYSRSGRVVKGQDKAIVRSKYEEDVHPGNHQSVFGSFWRAGRWGFACCHGFDKMAYCTGEAGKLALAAARPEQLMLNMAQRNEAKAAEAAAAAASTTLVEQHQERRKKDKEEKKRAKEAKRKRDGSGGGSDSEPEDEEAARTKRIKAAMKRQELEEQQAEALMAIDERKRPYQSLQTSNAAPTEEEMEAFRMRQVNANDPMAAFLRENKK